MRKTTPCRETKDLAESDSASSQMRAGLDRKLDTRVCTANSSMEPRTCMTHMAISVEEGNQRENQMGVLEIKAAVTHNCKWNTSEKGVN
jgi:hypothetical protein